MSKPFVLRVQSAQGTKRIDINPQDTYTNLYEKVADVFSLSSSDNFILYKEQNKKSPLTRSQTKTNLRHGDMIYLISQRDNIKSDDILINENTHLKLIDFNQDDIDVQLDKTDGRIAREKNSSLCHHNIHGKCLHCIPIEPYDEQFLQNRNPPIKHMSFWAYIKKLQHSSSGDRHTYASLENINCSIKDNCSTGHAPWPKGVCTKCQPNPLTLMRQSYRHVDNIMFENGNMVNRFLNYWRSSGHQRIGFLYGKYEVYDGVPLGIRAVVAAIYEPPQKTSRDSVELIFPDPDEALINELASRLGMRCIGWIFTDLVPDEKKSGNGPVIHHRGNVDSYFLTAQECIMAGWFQNKHPNICKYSPDGYFGSKFVTIVVTGNASGQIHFEGYQVSNQCMALVKSQILLPTHDAPELGYIKETSSEQYVPDVFYKEKDIYKNEVMKVGRPLPLEYLIIDVPTGFPTDNAKIQSIFNDNCSVIKTPFYVENRKQIDEIQNMTVLATYLNQFRTGVTTATPRRYKATDVLSDLHLLRYLVINDIVPFSMGQLNPLLDSLRVNDLDGVEAWMKGAGWQTVVQLLQTYTPTPQPTSNRPPHMDFENANDMEEDMSRWNCPQCTFLNNGSSKKCDICPFERNF